MKKDDKIIIGVSAMLVIAFAGFGIYQTYKRGKEFKELKSSIDEIIKKHDK